MDCARARRLRFHFARRVLLVAALSALTCSAENGVLGTWREPTGSSIEIANCGKEICLRIVSFGTHAPSDHKDVRNPNASLRGRSLCHLQIGQGFHLAGNDTAQGGTVYDPKTGKTYKGSMTRVGNDLHLRGYVGLRIFGKTETWTRSENPPPC
jgi:uncharacterized protein (DUF2147 family)